MRLELRKFPLQTLEAVISWSVLLQLSPWPEILPWPGVWGDDSRVFSLAQTSERPYHTFAVTGDLPKSQEHGILNERPPCYHLCQDVLAKLVF